MVTRSKTAAAKPRTTARRTAAQAPQKAAVKPAVKAAPTGPAAPAATTAAAATAAPPQATRTAKPAKAAKAPKVPKAPKVAKEEKKDKLVRDSFTMPESEFRAIAAIKKRAMGLGREVKKSEVLRAGLKALQGLSDPQFKALVETLVVIKTGRPKKSAH